MKLTLPCCVILIVMVTLLIAGDQKDEQLLEATRKGDVTAVKSLLEAGANVNALARYNVTPLFFAADRGNLEIVRLLIENGADVNAKDTFYNTTPLGMASYNGHMEVVELLLKNQAAGADDLLTEAVSGNNVALAEIVVSNANLDSSILLNNLLLAVQTDKTEIAALLKKNGVQLPEDMPRALTEAQLRLYSGFFRNVERDMSMKFQAEEGKLKGAFGNRDPFTYVPTAKEHTLSAAERPGLEITFEIENGQPVAVNLTQGNFQARLAAAEETAGTAAADTESQAPTEPQAEFPELLKSGSSLVKSPVNWPSFRGKDASGVADGQYPPVKWNGESGENIKWKLAIPGFSHSSPVIWGEKLFITTAVSSDTGAVLRVGLYGDVKPDADVSEHVWKVYAINRKNGKMIWEKESWRGIPKVKRHTKASQANSTAATNGKYVVALFGAEGLYCYDMAGELKWKKDLGYLDSGWFYDPDYQWGHGSSPIIYQDMVIVQCDIQKDSYIAAYRLSDGSEAWKTSRDEIPSWATPTVYQGAAGDELITNGTTAIRGYDPATGKELWTLGGSSEIAVPTPLLAHGLIYVTNGYRPIQPIYAIKPGSRGDISLNDKEESNTQIVWSKQRGGPYMPTPVIYGDYMYVCANNGTLTVYDARTGEQQYRQRLGGRGSGYGFTASPVAADGKVYFSSEDGEVYIIRAGSEYQQLAVNQLDEVIMATPAISDGMLYIRAQSHLYGIGQ